MNSHSFCKGQFTAKYCQILRHFPTFWPKNLSENIRFYKVLTSSFISTFFKVFQVFSGSLVLRLLYTRFPFAPVPQRPEQVNDRDGKLPSPPCSSRSPLNRNSNKRFCYNTHRERLEELYCHNGNRLKVKVRKRNRKGLKQSPGAGGLVGGLKVVLFLILQVIEKKVPVISGCCRFPGW